MNSSQTHLLTEINLADVVRQVESVEQHLYVYKIEHHFSVSHFSTIEGLGDGKKHEMSAYCYLLSFLCYYYSESEREIHNLM